MANRSKRKQFHRRKVMNLMERPILDSNAGGIDIGAREMYVAVPPDRDEQPVRVFNAFTEDLEQLADWLVGCGVTTVAMESTGVYWIPLYEILESHGIKPCLVNARHMKNVPGRRTDWHECQWLQYLHSVGLLRGAFRPQADVVAVRSIMRHRAEMVQMAGQHIQHMHKALTQMNLQIQHVISDITGVTGMAIVEAILQGERNPDELVKLRDCRVKADIETVRKSLVGTWKPEHLFTLKQSRHLYRIYQEQIVDCDQQIEQLLSAFDNKVDPDEKPLPPNRKNHGSGKKRRKKRNHPDTGFDLRTEAYRLFGVDTTQIPGLETLVLPLFSELGRDMSRWPTAAHFVSWAALCPDNDISGGRVLWRGSRKAKNRTGQLFKLAAHSLHRSASTLGNYLRQKRARLGPAGAINATAQKIATIFYTMIKNQVEYDETTWMARQKESQKRFEAKIRRQAKNLGYELVPVATNAGV